MPTAFSPSAVVGPDSCVAVVPRLFHGLEGRTFRAIPQSLLRWATSSAVDEGQAERIGKKARWRNLALAAPTVDKATAALPAVGIENHTFVKSADGAGGISVPALSQSLPDLVSRTQVQDMAT